MASAPRKTALDPPMDLPEFVLQACSIQAAAGVTLLSFLRSLRTALLPYAGRGHDDTF